MKKLLILALFIIALGYLASFVYKDFVSTPISITPEGNSIITNSTTTSVGGIDIDTSGGGSVSIEKVPVDDSIKKPSLDRAITIPPVFEGKSKEIMETRIKDTIKVLRADPNNTDAWFSLAVSRKMIGDYIGASEIWEYLNLAYPTNSLSFSNLGSLYHFELKNFEKAETNYKIAIKNDPTRIDIYRNLYELYSVYKKGTSAGLNILLQGLNVNKGNPDLLVLVGEYYKSIGDKTNALKFYKQALEASKNLGSAGTQSLEEIISSLESPL